MVKEQSQYESNPEIAPFFSGLRENRLLVKKCIRCERLHYYPRAVCPFCFGSTVWYECSGYATLYSFSIMQFEQHPLVIAYVRLDEGVTMLTNLVGIEPSDIKIGMKLKASFAEDLAMNDGVSFSLA